MPGGREPGTWDGVAALRRRGEGAGKRVGEKLGKD